jgi:hypothetical protein
MLIFVMELIAYAVDAELVLAFQNGTRRGFGSFFLYRCFRCPLDGLRLSQSVEVGPGCQKRQEDPHEEPRIPVQRPTRQHSN